MFHSELFKYTFFVLHRSIIHSCLQLLFYTTRNIYGTEFFYTYICYKTNLCVLLVNKNQFQNQKLKLKFYYFHKMVLKVKQ